MFWGSWQSGCGIRWGGGFFFLPLIFCCGMNWLLNSGVGLGGFEILMLLLVLIFVAPVLLRTFNQAFPGVEKQKRKRDDEALTTVEAQDTRYILGDDGEVIPIEDDEKPKRQDYL